MDFNFSHSLPRPSTSGDSLAAVGVLGDLPAAWVFSLDFLDAHGVELLPNSKSPSASSKVVAHVFFLLVLSGVAILGFPDWGTGGGDDSAAGAERLLTVEAPGVLTQSDRTTEGGGVITVYGRTSGRLW
jgi:hypothetical protein